jgi:hypothetical protein
VLLDEKDGASVIFDGMTGVGASESLRGGVNGAALRSVPLIVLISCCDGGLLVDGSA